jgi:hypothetical protein
MDGQNTRPTGLTMEKLAVADDTLALVRDQVVRVPRRRIQFTEEWGQFSVDLALSCDSFGGEFERNRVQCSLNRALLV